MFICGLTHDKVDLGEKLRGGPECAVPRPGGTGLQELQSWPRRKYQDSSVLVRGVHDCEGLGIKVCKVLG